MKVQRHQTVFLKDALKNKTKGVTHAFIGHSLHLHNCLDKSMFTGFIMFTDKLTSLVHFYICSTSLKSESQKFCLKKATKE